PERDAAGGAPAADPPGAPGLGGGNRPCGRLPGQPPGGVCNRDDVARQWWYVHVGIGNGAGPSKVKSVQPQQAGPGATVFPQEAVRWPGLFFLTQTRSPVELIWL